MRVAFAGCHEISLQCLREIAQLCKQSGDELAGAFNLLPEKGAKYSAFVEFDSLAKEYGFPLHKVVDLAAPETIALLNSLKLDAFFIIGWHKIVPQSVIDCAPICLGMHSSLLPKNRGSSPINWQIIHGEKQGGMSYFHLTTGVDSGDLVAQKGFEISLHDTCADAYDKATVLALEMLQENWPALREKRLPHIPQDETQVTLNPRRKPEDGLIDWKKGSIELHNWMRALTHPYPGGFTFLRGKKLFIWKATLADGAPTGASANQPGELVTAGAKIIVATGDGTLELLSFQFEGEREMAAADFSEKYALHPGEKMG